MAETTMMEEQAATRSRPSKLATEKTARAYFDAINARDLDAAVAMWAPDGRENVRGQVDVSGHQGIRAFLEGLAGAVPDAHLEIVSTTADADRCAVQWRLTGTFAGPEPFNGIAPTGSRIELEGVDVLTVRDGLIRYNDAFTDSMTFARQIGMMPPRGSTAEQRLASAFNVKTRVARRRVTAAPERVAEGVWLVRGGLRGLMNVYLIADGNGVLAFDAGVRSMVPAIAAAAASLGGLTRVVLGHAHADHRGAANGLAVPVLCHADERGDAQGDGGLHSFDLSKLKPGGKTVFTRLLKAWDGGPVKIDETLREGDRVGGFEVLHLPGHAPGLIGLWRASDRLMLSSDCFYTIDPETMIKGAPRIPHPAFTPDRDAARASIRRVAALDPAAAWPGHGNPALGDVRTQLEQAAAGA
jgi:hydroxyacylglutathione hydrolase